MLKNNPLRGDNVYLDSIWLSSDGPTMFKWRNDFRIFRWCRQHDLNEWIKHENYIKGLSLDNTSKFYAVRSIEKDQLVGVCGLSSIDLVNQRAEFSLYIGPEHQKLGYGKDALHTLCNWSFLHLPLNIIWGETFAENPAWPMFQSLGFQKEGVRRDFYYREGEFIDCILFSLKRNELIT